MTQPTDVKAAWALPVDEVMARLQTPSGGLSLTEAKRRLRRDGPNRLVQKGARSAWWILVAQFRSLLVGILTAAAVAAFAFGRLLEAFAVVGVLAVNAAIGFWMELRATRSVEALRKLVRTQVTVSRGGDLVRIPAEELVLGDVVVVEAGDVITADVRVSESNRLAADESVLTGESVPVLKRTTAVDADAMLAERSSMLFNGTVVTRGSGRGVVVATAPYSELGQIAELIDSDHDETTPLERRLDQLGRRLAWLSGAIALLVALTSGIAGRSLLEAVEIAIALAVATVPEGLPIVATLALARGMWRMAERKALVRRLSAVETLGSTSIIVTDKTGTLTENRLTVTHLWLAGHQLELRGSGPDGHGLYESGRVASEEMVALARRALRIGVLCNNADLAADPQQRGVGDPLELALLTAGSRLGIEQDTEKARAPELREEAFDSETQLMATYHGGDSPQIAVKGSPEKVLAACTEVATTAGQEPLDEATRQKILRSAGELANEGLRLLALAERTGAASEPPYERLCFVGMVGMRDPARADVSEVLDACNAAGVRVVMATGDHPATAERVAKHVGLDTEGGTVIGSRLGHWLADDDHRESSVFARTSPKQKLDLLRGFRKRGAVVAMVGDGVNDAPALKAADIGVAMGKRGTEVAKEAADIVLQDDELATVVVAMREGRVIFDNLRKFAVYLLSCNASELLAVGSATLLGLPLPLLPLQILFLNLVTDVFPALALSACEAGAGVMSRRPRPADEALLTPEHWWRILAHGLLITLAVLSSLELALDWLGLTTEQAVTVSFLTLGFGQTVHVFNMRSLGSSLSNEVSRNLLVWGAVLLCAAVLLVAVTWPDLMRVLGTRTLPAQAWLLVAACSLTPVLFGPPLDAWVRRVNRSPHEPAGGAS